MNHSCNAEGPELARLFVSCRFDAETTRALASMRDASCGLRWMLPETYHITLYFLGKTPVALIPDIKRALEGVRMPRLTAEQGPMGCFYHGQRCVLNAGIVKSPELAALHERVLDALESVTGPLERRHWTPHVTLGRGHADRKPSREDLAAWMAERDRLPRLRFPLTSFELVQSVLRPVMAEHTVLASYPLI